MVFCNCRCYLDGHSTQIIAIETHFWRQQYSYMRPLCWKSLTFPHFSRSLMRIHSGIFLAYRLRMDGTYFIKQTHFPICDTTRKSRRRQTYEKVLYFVQCRSMQWSTWKRLYHHALTKPKDMPASPRQCSPQAWCWRLPRSIDVPMEKLIKLFARMWASDHRWEQGKISPPLVQGRDVDFLLECTYAEKRWINSLWRALKLHSLCLMQCLYLPFYHNCSQY